MSKEIDDLKKDLNHLRERIWILENPPKYKIGDIVFIQFSSNYADNYISKEVVGIDRSVPYRGYVLRGEEGFVFTMVEHEIISHMENYKRKHEQIQR